MKKEKYLIITGSTGYIGSNFVESFIDKDFNIIYTKRATKQNYKYYDLKNKIFNLSNLLDSEIIFLHLATYFSKAKEDQEEVIYSNELFGKQVFDELKKYNLKKVIYTNSMYLYYDDSSVRNLPYTLTKKNFSNFLRINTDLNSILYEEIFFDNTFGNLDKRPKVVPLIMKSIVENTENPVLNKGAYINLVNVEDVIERLKISITSNDQGKTSFINYKSINLDSIYNFLKNYKITRENKVELLKYKDNSYINDYPEIEHKNIKLKKMSNSLIEELKNYENK